MMSSSGYFSPGWRDFTAVSVVTGDSRAAYVNIEADDSRKAQGSEEHDVAAPLCENILSCLRWLTSTDTGILRIGTGQTK